MTNITGIHHCSVLVADTGKSVKFYRDILGLQLIERPDLPFPGAWLAAGDQQIHLLELAESCAMEDRSGHGGRDRHMALTCRNLEELTNCLDKAGVSYTRSRSGRAAVFCRDPDGNAIEVMQL